MSLDGREAISEPTPPDAEEGRMNPPFHVVLLNLIQEEADNTNLPGAAGIVASQSVLAWLEVFKLARIPDRLAEEILRELLMIAFRVSSEIKDAIKETLETNPDFGTMSSENTTETPPTPS